MSSKWLLILFIFIAAVQCQSRDEPHPAPSQQKKPHPVVSVSPGEIGSQLPDFSVANLQGGTIRSADLKGKVVIIDFWAPWCQPCAKEMPGYQTLLDRYTEKQIAVVGFKADVMADNEDPLHFARKLGVRYPIAIGNEEIRKKFGGLLGLPTTFIYDRDGVLRSKVIGFESVDTFDFSIKRLLQAK